MSNNLQTSYWIIETLLEFGITQFVISPGSRSTPLTVAAARHRQITTHVHFDERGAGFFALGLSKATGIPAVLVCTSGTAVANYFPAVVEASMDNIPLIILSADRPPELIDVGANQAIFQENIYGIYTRTAENLPPPNAESSRSSIRDSVIRMVEAAMGRRPGPVQLNCQFREPLLPETGPTLAAPHTDLPRQSVRVPPVALPDLEPLAKRLAATRQGLIVVGRGLQEGMGSAILDLATRLGWPLLPDIQSALRFQDHPNIINHFDLIMLNSGALGHLPETVLHFGSAFTSKRLLSYLAQQSSFYINIKTTPERIDPNHQVDLTLVLSPHHFCTSLQFTESAGSRQWLTNWQQLEDRTRKHLQQTFAGSNTLSEPGIAYTLSELLPVGHGLMLANSMAIREMEMFGATRAGSTSTIANRGSSGIDGLVATAAGFQLGRGKPLTLLMGDLALLHDLNSLKLLADSGRDITLIVINNHGGGIFNFLPVREESDIFEPFFGTPHDLSFEKAAEMFGLPYARPASPGEFRQVYTEVATKPGSAMIEVETDRYANHDLHLRIFHALRAI